MWELKTGWELGKSTPGQLGIYSSKGCLQQECIKMGLSLSVLGIPLRTWWMLLKPAMLSARIQPHQVTQYKKGKRGNVVLEQEIVTVVDSLSLRACIKADGTRDWAVHVCLASKTCGHLELDMTGGESKKWFCCNWILLWRQKNHEFVKKKIKAPKSHGWRRGSWYPSSAQLLATDKFRECRTHCFRFCASFPWPEWNKWITEQKPNHKCGKLTHGDRAGSWQRYRKVRDPVGREWASCLWTETLELRIILTWIYIVNC